MNCGNGRSVDDLRKVWHFSTASVFVANALLPRFERKSARIVFFSTPRGCVVLRAIHGKNYSMRKEEGDGRNERRHFEMDAFLFASTFPTHSNRS